MRERFFPGDHRARYLGFAGLALVTAVLSGCFSLGALVARRMVTPGKKTLSPVTVLAVDEGAHGEPGVVRLSLGDDTDLPGNNYSLIFNESGATVASGHARLGALLRICRPGEAITGAKASAGWVERELLGVDRGEIRTGSRGRITGWWYADAASLGGTVEEIELPLSGGLAKAWVIPAQGPGGQTSPRWAVHVHGRGAQPEETLRGVRVARESGRTSLVISYRGDIGAPASLNNRYGFGAAEWRDVSAAMAEAVQRGATNITLFGWSMGGTACLLAADRSPQAALVDGLVLDSPALNWRELTVHHASLARVPALFGWIGAWLLESGLVRSGVPGGIPLRELNPGAFAEKLAAPTLVHCGPGDTFVPEQPALEFGRLCPELVTINRVEHGQHVRLWNVDPQRWDDVTLEFLARL